ncbi:methionyl-tRNA formyltransferase [Haloarcula sp. KBTZ06]|uniref:methionyl-tRNA formyltransferase n=1 Tax=unclassified Haloarcula TaxID=2624677 RepID=UPI00073F2C19|nr:MULTISPECIES: formyltransferase family protein [unclassified Haloarcula]KAA9406606.1 methionyl-tRNA formyltransferase [Haloarcula sp. CBA1131]
MIDTKILLATFYRSGILAIRQLLNSGFEKEQLRVLTYDIERNEELLEFLEKKDISYKTDDISDPDTESWIEAFNPDLIFSLYYRDKIPSRILDIPQYGGVNLHPSLLPQYAGVLSVPWAMVEGESRTGYTYHYMTDEIDTGPILKQEEVSIGPTDTAYSLYHRLIHAGMSNFLPVLELIVEEEYSGRPQTGVGTYHGRGDLPNDGVINHQWSDDEIDRFIRAMYYPPFRPAVAEFGGQEFEITSMAEYRRLRRRHGIKQ